MQDLCRRADPTLSQATLLGYGAWLVAISSLFNGVGRIFWGGFSDRFGRVNTFRLMIASGIVAFGMLTQVSSPWLFGGLICYILLCYGGGFGTMPSFVLDAFGPGLMAVVYGVILTAWSAAAAVGPMIFAGIKDHYKTQLDLASRYSFLTACGFLVIGLIATLLIRQKATDR
jgi:OFA family oxalate/formate antiporter-like MFS transporter